ncbi:M3 family metallopeptidase [Nakamurella endophytica]|uniref:Peptidyl-dipeptidase Dcp n=1 Tax=Nakamurella endophytica TaxID=1748367 RepID=A0A917T3I7_9ACTN|nr:M3 family metallopeptidase [Nakamurella endophytica]GGM08935.1 peptidyl-dipeptidase Dcp [Nakamurella endophytica]
MTAPSLDPANPFAAPSSLPFGLPPFAAIRDEHYAPAFEAGRAQQLAEVEAIASDPRPPDLENTLVALERSGQLLERVAATFYNLVSSVATPELRRIEAEQAPLMAAHRDAIRLHRPLFARIDAVHRGRESAGLGPESRRLVERYHLDFVLAGAQLDPAGQDQLRELNREISVLTTTFQQNLQQATEAAAVLVTEEAQLAGMSGEARNAAAAAARARGVDGGYLLPLVLPTSQPALAVLSDRDTRRRLFEASVSRASAGEHDNGPVAVQIARLRACRARLLGFATHADAMVADQTAGSSAAVDGLLSRLVAPALANARMEAAALAQAAARDGVELAPWDWAYYSERVRAERYAVDTAALRPYFELDRVLADGVFHAAEQVYGIRFRRRPDLSGYHPDVRVWEVLDGDGTSLGLYLGDYFARDGKRGGAWMNSYVEQSALLGTRPVVANNLNVPAPAAGEKALLTLDEVDTLFHEFGHALHGLFSDVTYPRFSGTSVPRDFVEFPSQVNEMWAMWPEVLQHYAFHTVTGEPLDPAVVEAIRAARQWGEGHATTEYLGATLLDQAWHRIGPDEEIRSATDFEVAALERAGIAFDLVPPRYRTTYFQHIFAGAYSAGYYSYIWSEVLDADTVEWFRENGGMRRENGDVFRRRLLSRGGAVDSLAAFRDVRGRDGDPGPLLRRRGLDRTVA